MNKFLIVLAVSALCTALSGQCSVSISDNTPNCSGACSIILTAVATGAEPFQFTWGNGSTEATQSLLCSGTYTVTVTDGLGCEANGSITVITAPELMISLDTPRPACFQDCTGEAMVEVNGGVAPYTYFWSNGSVSGTIEGLCAGDYSVTVTDAEGCSVSQGLSVDDLPEIIITETIIDVECGGDCSGSIELTVSGGSPPYVYQWSDLSGNGSEARSQLCAGMYLVTITDTNDCTQIRSYEVKETPELSAAYIVEGTCEEDGSAQNGLVVSGGTAPYTILWSDGSAAPTITPGTDPYAQYQVTISDQNACFVELTGITGYELFQEEGQVLPLLSCQEGVMADNSPPAGYSRSIVTPAGDTVPGSDYLFREIGNYTYLDLSADQTCLRRGSVTVFDNGLHEEVMLSALDSLNCGAYNCLVVDGLTNEQLFSGELSVTFFGPEGIPFPGTGSYQLCTVDRPGNYTVEVVLGCDTVRRSLFVAEPTACSTLSGFVFAEAEGNCSFDPGDVPASQTLVRIEAADGTVYHAISGSDGYFEVAVPSGSYTLAPVPALEASVEPCPAVTAEVFPAGAAVVDLFFQAPTNCFELRTWISLVTLRRCGFLNRLSVYYDNPSSVVAHDVQLTLELDPLYTNLSTSYPVASQFGDVLTFEIDSLQPFAFGRIDVFFQIDCGAELGQTHCVRSLITPAGFCDEDDGPDEALVSITEARCTGDSVAFRVRNIGDQVMTVPLQYVVVEDGIMMRTDPFVEEALEPGQIVDVLLPATGATYQITTNQEPAVPVSHDPSRLVEGCTTAPGAPFTTGQSNILPVGNGVPWEDIVCRVNTGAEDPNDKYGYPRGYAGGQIAAGTRIDYDIRFQNNGTDTAFTVVIRDTLSGALDIATLRMEGGSHDYTTALDTNRILTITFNNILLVDSLTNEPLSHGMVSFSIDHAPWLQPGDAIDNRVGIYFDNNDPVITNLSHHEIATEPLPNAVLYLVPDPVALRVFPNPVPDKLHVRAAGGNIRPEQVLIIADLAGREVARTDYATAASGWNVGELAAGYYLLVLLDENGRALGRAGFVRK